MGGSSAPLFGPSCASALAVPPIKEKIIILIERI